MNAAPPTVGTLEAFSLVVRRELCLSFRRPDQLLQPLVFFLIVTTLFPLGLSLQLSLLRDMAPGVLWVAALLSSLLALDSLFKSDADDGTLESPSSWLRRLSLIGWSAVRRWYWYRRSSARHSVFRPAYLRP